MYYTIGRRFSTVKSISFRVNDELIKSLNIYAKENKTEFISKAIREYIRGLQEYKITDQIDKKESSDMNFLHPYIDQLKAHIICLENEIEYLRNNNKQLLEEYHKQINDKTKQYGETFNRVIHFIEESQRYAMLQIRENNHNKFNDKKRNIDYQRYRM